MNSIETTEVSFDQDSTVDAIQRFLKFCRLFVPLILQFIRPLCLSHLFRKEYLFYGLIQLDSSPLRFKQKKKPQKISFVVDKRSFDADTREFIDGIQCDYFESLLFFIIRIILRSIQSFFNFSLWILFASDPSTYAPKVSDEGKMYETNANNTSY